MNDSDSCIKVCNQLLRGELSAIETYLQAIEEFKDSPAEIEALEQILMDHENSAESLRDHLDEMGAIPDTDSGAWGAFAKAVEGTATLLGESAALMALKEGEEHGIREYEEALDNLDVMEDAKATIREQLLPRLMSHLPKLESLRS